MLSLALTNLDIFEKPKARSPSTNSPLTLAVKIGSSLIDCLADPIKSPTVNPFAELTEHRELQWIIVPVSRMSWSDFWGNLTNTY